MELNNQKENEFNEILEIRSKTFMNVLNFIFWNNNKINLKK